MKKKNRFVIIEHYMECLQNAIEYLNLRLARFQRYILPNMALLLLVVFSHDDT